MNSMPAAVRFVQLTVAATLVTTVVWPVRASAQVRSAPLAAGTRVRVTSPLLSTEPKVAIVLARLPDTLAIREEGTRDSVAVPFAAITELEVFDGAHTRVLKGMGIGFLAGAATGALMGAASYRDCAGCDFDLGRGGDAFLGGVAGAVVGPLIGGVAGAIWRTEGWVPLAFESRVSGRLRPAPTWMSGVTLSFAF